MQIYLPIAEVAVNALVLIGLGGIVGLMSGLFGVGGGFLITPLLFFIGIPPAIAVATGANQVVASSFSGVLAHVKRKTVDFRMGWVLLAGGLVGSSAGVLLFNMLSRLGQVDLVVQLCYVVFLGLIGAMMLQESLRALRRTRVSGPIKPTRRHQHGWVHRWPLKMKFRASGLYISAIPVLGVGAVVGVLGALMGVGGSTLLPSSLAIIGTVFTDPRQRSTAIGIWAAWFGAGFAIQWIDWVNGAHDMALEPPIYPTASYLGLAALHFLNARGIREQSKDK